MPSPKPGHAILMAAGASRRMGRDKAALPWTGDRPLAACLADALAQAGWSVVIVLGPHNLAWGQRELRGHRTVLNPTPESGKAGSLLCGWQALPPSPGAVLVTAVDQPRPVALYRLLAERTLAEPGRILVPDEDGAPGHPVVLGRECQALLATVRDADFGLRGLLARQAELVLPVPVPGKACRWDLNDPEAYARARSQLDQT